MTWLLRWNTIEEARPRALSPAGSEPGRAAVFESESGDFAVFDGYLFDRADLEVGAGRSDAALVASAHERWKDGLFEKLRGGFAAAIWDRQQQRLIVGRDATGLNPCFYWWNGRTFLASPSLDAILAQPEVEGRFNRLVIAEYVYDAMSSHQTQETFYEDVRRLPPAHVLSICGRQLTISRYWDPVPPGFSWASEEELCRFEPVVERAVARCLSVGADSIALSGGFDSVSLAVLAAEQLKGRTPLHALSLRFVGTVCDETDTQVAVARTLGMPQLIRTIEESLSGDTPVGAAMALARTSSSPVLSPWQSVYTGLFTSAAALGVSRPLMGTGGDDMLIIDSAYGADRLAALDLRGLWRYLRVRQRTSRLSAWHVARAVLWDEAIVREFKRCARSALGRVSARGLERLLEYRRQRWLAPWLLPGDEDLRALIGHRWANPVPIPLAPGERSYVGSLRRLTQAPLMLLERDQSHAWAKRLGFTFFYPYYDQDVVELSLRMQPEHLMADGRVKTPLRRLVARRLPAVPLRAKKVEVTQMVHRILRAGGAEAWRDLGGPAMLAELGIVDPDRLNPLMDEYFTGRNQDSLRTWLVLSTEIWLRARSEDRFKSGSRRE